MSDVAQIVGGVTIGLIVGYLVVGPLLMLIASAVGACESRRLRGRIRKAEAGQRLQGASLNYRDGCAERPYRGNP